MSKQSKKNNQEYLGIFELFVMLAIQDLRDNAYGIAIQFLIEKKLYRKISVGALYTTLNRLHKKGFTSSIKSTIVNLPGGRAKNMFMITTKGEFVVQKTLEAIEKMVINEET